MEQLSYMGWFFAFHRRGTQRLSRTFPRANPEIRCCLPELRRLLERLGVDVQRPAFQGYEDSACDLFLGTAYAQGGFELDFYGAGQYQSVVIHPCPGGYEEDGLDIKAPCVLLEVFGLYRQDGRKHI